MNIENRTIEGGVTLGIIRTDKFKNNYFAVNYLLPLSDKNISECNVLANVLLRGTKSFPTVSLMSKHIGMIYDPSIEVSATKTSHALVFKVGAYFLGNEYLPENESLDVFSEVTALLYELLKAPVTENGALSASYTESEKKRQIDRIRAKINNKDSYALGRCNSIMLGDIPAACEALGTEADVSSVSPQSLYEMLDYILKKCPIEAVFAGSYTKDAEMTLLSFISSITDGRKEEDVISLPGLVKPTFDIGVKEANEDIAATQGRMVMGFSMPDAGEDSAPIEVFNDIFGGSPVSRLFANVRERLQLCYYCASAQNLSLNVMYVRSGINRENVLLAREEILRQLDDLKNPENVLEDELHASRAGLISGMNAMRDSLSRYATWYINRRIAGRHTDIDKCIENIRHVDAEAVSGVAREVRLTVNYFLNGIEG